MSQITDLDIEPARAFDDNSTHSGKHLEGSKNEETITQAIGVGEDTKHDAVFGDLEGGVNYRGLSFWGTVVTLVKTQIGVGVLSFPFTLQVLGLIPGLICFFMLAGMTTWADIVIGDFKLKHRDIYAMDDLGRYMYGKWGQRIFSVMIIVYQLIACGLGLSSVSTAFNGVSAHAACTAVFMAVSAIICFGAASVQTLGRLSWLLGIGSASILISVMTLVIAVGVQTRPSAAPQTGPWEKDFKLFGDPTFADASAALGSIVYTVCGTSAFFPIISEMRDPRLYKRAVYVCQGTIVFMNFLVGTVVYYYCGQYVTSPAPGSAGPLLKKVIYGLALPGVIMGATCLIHILSKYSFVRVMRGSRHLTAKTWQHRAAWLGCTFTCTLLAYIIASAIPVFSVLTAIGGSFLGPFVCLQPYGLMWFFDNKKADARSRTKWSWMAAWAAFMVIGGCYVQVTGTYGSIVQIIATFNQGRNTPFGCADNSGSVASS